MMVQKYQDELNIKDRMINFGAKLEIDQAIYLEFISSAVNSSLNWDRKNYYDSSISSDKIDIVLKKLTAAGYQYRYHASRYTHDKILVIKKEGEAIVLLNYPKNSKFNLSECFFAEGKDNCLLIKLLDEYCSERENKIRFKWITSHEGDYEMIDESMEETIHPEHYPFIDNLLEWEEKFFASKSPVLILLGSPGGGKSTFIKYLLSKMGDGINHLTFDSKALNSEQIFVDFLADEEANSFILEDADTLLTKREDGNDVMAKFLNISNGLISLKKKKLIFSTNLDNLNHVDSALLRPGRCFGVLEFRKLTYNESIRVCEVNGISSSFLKKGNEYTLAEIFAGKKGKEERIGFI